MNDTSQTASTPDSKMSNEKYRHLYVVIEHEEGNLLPVNFEMLGEARRLMDGFNVRYSAEEKVVAILLGNEMRSQCDKLISYGADAVIYAENPELKYHRNLVYTKVISQIANDKDCSKKISARYSEEFKRPRFMFFSADDTGRHLSATVLAELESGLASDINKLVIDDIELKHEHKTKGQLEKYSKTLEMYRPDFSGFLWTTILCLDNRHPNNRREYHPQACSIIPGVFQPIEPDTNRKGVIVDFKATLNTDDLGVKILNRKVVKSPIDYDSHKAIVSFGRGINESPEENIALIDSLKQELGAEVGISLPISKKTYNISNSKLSAYITPERVIGTSGRKVAPTLYIAVGISGAMQHIAGMKESEFVIAINPDTDSPIRDECDIFIKGRLEDVLPVLIEELRQQKAMVEVRN
ncbi:MAG: electron transfer flavoprotein subunit alpha/FixB family protein [Nitrososphaeraceae archaeon]|jgi:electron transfer flavoprotein alpha subunit